MSYNVVRVSNRSQLKDFIELPFRIYRNDPNWVAPMKSELKRILDKEKNPYFKEASLDLFNCYNDEKISARVSIVVNKAFCQKTGVKIAFFGFFETYDDQESVHALFNEVFKYCSETGIQRIEGPFNPNLYSELGMQCSSYNSSPSFFQTYNPSYYNKLLTDNGFEILKTLHTRINRNIAGYLNTNFPDTVQLDFKDLSVRSINMKNLEADLEHLRDIFNDSFSENWHFTNVSKEEYLFASKYLDMVTPPELIKFVEYKGRPIAAVHFALDINPLLKNFRGRRRLIPYLKFLRERKKIKNILIFATGTKKAFRNTRAVQLLFNLTVELARKYRVLESTWMYDDNKTVVSLAEKLGLEKDKEFHIYFKDLA